MNFLSAHRANLAGLSDPDVLTLAAEQRRILVTHDFRTMPNHFTAFLSRNGFSPGVFLLKQRLSVAVAIEELIFVWNLSDASDWENRILEIPL